MKTRIIIVVLIVWIYAVQAQDFVVNIDGVAVVPNQISLFSGYEVTSNRSVDADKNQTIYRSSNSEYFLLHSRANEDTGIVKLYDKNGDVLWQRDEKDAVSLKVHNNGFVSALSEAPLSGNTQYRLISRKNKDLVNLDSIYSYSSTFDGISYAFLIRKNSKYTLLYKNISSNNSWEISVGTDGWKLQSVISVNGDLAYSLNDSIYYYDKLGALVWKKYFENGILKISSSGNCLLLIHQLKDIITIDTETGNVIANKNTFNEVECKPYLGDFVIGTDIIVTSNSVDRINTKLQFYNKNLELLNSILVNATFKGNFFVNQLVGGEYDIYFDNVLVEAGKNIDLQ